MLASVVLIAALHDFVPEALNPHTFGVLFFGLSGILFVASLIFVPWGLWDALLAFRKNPALKTTANKSRVALASLYLCFPALLLLKLLIA